mmetsp:Transcript_39711/g.64460  ORF Transcript_39711/g.64460 Transcript_39711/m.64460 type:complete len:697 (-) Transcript_39711:741-2831(-)
MDWCGGTEDVLPMERLKSSFDVEVMTHVLDGGVKNTMRRRWITAAHEGVENFVHAEKTREELIAHALKHFMEVHREHFENGYKPKGLDMSMMSDARMTSSALTINFGVFSSTLRSQSSDLQQKWWLEKARKGQIIGSYAQTELGHGSNVRGLQTTAVYDRDTQEFILNTPTLQSIKWWPSSMATSTHTVLYAQLVIDGKEYGLHVFFLQLRDENLLPLPGIEVGDLGTKMGENEVDIGYLRLKDVRVPRKHMMEKRQHVEPDGTYVKHDLGGGNNEKAAYLTMMTARTQMVGGSAIFLSKGATIAMRYNAVRRQGFVDTAKGQSYRAAENKIIDYKMNQYVLLSKLSLAFAIRFTFNWLMDRMDELSANPDDLGADLPEIHASAAGLKGYCCNAAALGLEELRKSCGGAGYLMASGIAGLVSDYKWRATAEGETTVMLLQTARYLMKAAGDAEAGRPLAGLTECLSVLKGPNVVPQAPKPATRADEYLSIGYLLEWFRYRTVCQVKITKDALNARMNSGQTYDQAWSELTLRAATTGQSHVLYFMLTKFSQMVETCEDAQCRSVLERVCALFALSDMIDGKQWTGLIDVVQFQLIEHATSLVCSALRPDAIALTDCWDYNDKALNSTIGSKDGNVYENQYLAAKNAPINQKPVPEFFDAIKPFLDMEFLSLRNKTVEECDPGDTESYPPPLNKAKL